MEHEPPPPPTYKACGINGCILEDKHGGLCAIAFLDTASRGSRAARAPTPPPQPAAPPKPRPPPKPKVLPGAPEKWGGNVAGHLEDDVWEVEQLLGRRLGRYRRKEYLVRWSGWDAEGDTWEPRSGIDESMCDAYDRCHPEDSSPAVDSHPVGGGPSGEQPPSGQAASSSAETVPRRQTELQRALAASLADAPPKARPKAAAPKVSGGDAATTSAAAGGGRGRGGGRGGGRGRCGARGTAEASPHVPAPEPSAVAAAHRAADGAGSTFSDVRALLRAAGLSAYEVSFVDEGGYDDLDWLKQLQTEQLEKLALDNGFKQGHAMKLARCLTDSDVAERLELARQARRHGGGGTLPGAAGTAAQGGAAGGGDDWLSSGHEWVGQRVRRFFDMSTISDGVVVAWLPAQADDPALWHVRHDDGDEEDLDENEMQSAISAHVEQQPCSPEWCTEGHEWIGERVVRVFGGERIGGVVTRWLPKGKGRRAMWHLRHDDGDEEDLYENEAHAAIMAAAAAVAADKAEKAAKAAAAKAAAAKAAATKAAQAEAAAAAHASQARAKVEVAPRGGVKVEVEAEVEDDDSEEDIPISKRRRRDDHAARQSGIAGSAPNLKAQPKPPPHLPLPQQPSQPPPPPPPRGDERRGASSERDQDRRDSDRRDRTAPHSTNDDPVLRYLRGVDERDATIRGTADPKALKALRDGGHMREPHPALVDMLSRMQGRGNVSMTEMKHAFVSACGFNVVHNRFSAYLAGLPGHFECIGGSAGSVRLIGFPTGTTSASTSAAPPQPPHPPDRGRDHDRRDREQDRRDKDDGRRRSRSRSRGRGDERRDRRSRSCSRGRERRSRSRSRGRDRRSRSRGRERRVGRSRSRERRSRSRERAAVKTKRPRDGSPPRRAGFVRPAARSPTPELPPSGGHSGVDVRSAAPNVVEELYRRPAAEAFAGVRSMHISRTALSELASRRKLDDAISRLVRVRCGRPEQVQYPPHTCLYLMPAPNTMHLPVVL